MDDNFTLHTVLLNMTANTLKHDADFYQTTFTKQMAAWSIPIYKVAGCTTDGDSAQAKVGEFSHPVPDFMCRRSNVAPAMC